jgi:hypothetical protein
MQIGSLFWQSRALYVAAKLDIASVLGDQQLSADMIASSISVDEDGLFRLMRMLVAIGVFAEVSPRVFANNALSDCLREGHKNDVRAMVLMHNSPEMSSPWFQTLEAGIRTGRVPFHLAHGADLFEYMSDHADFDRLFAQAMDRVEALAGTDVIADAFDWSQFDRVIDIGGSKGAKALAILNKHPHLSALVIDRPQVVAEAIAYWGDKLDENLRSRIQFGSRDIREQVPQAQSGKDIYMLNAVLHGLGDKECASVLTNVRDACGQTNARIMINEIILPETGADLPGASFDMQMYIGTQGRERTRAEFGALFELSGLVWIEEIRTRSFASVMLLAVNPA